MSNHTQVRGIRGAISVSEDTAGEILFATKELLETMVERNELKTEDIASAFFTVTADLRSVFPAQAARAMGWKYIPLMCATEINVPESLPRVVRVLLHVNTKKSQKEIKHVYLREASKLRPELT